MDLPPTRQRRPLAESLLFLAVACAPFMQAFTLPVGFPLKLTEILGGLGLLCLLYEGRRRRFTVYGHKAITALAVLVLASACINDALSIPSLMHVGYQHGLTFDLVQYTVYGLFELAFGWAIATRLGIVEISKATSIAVRLTMVYCLIQFLAWRLDLGSLLAHVNGVIQVGISYGIPSPRNGPFLEGNYLGFFAGTAVFICGWHKDRFGVFCALALLVYSQTTSGLLALLGGLLAIGIAKRRIPFKMLLAGAACSSWLMFSSTGHHFLIVQESKIGISDSPVVDATATSRENRSQAMSAAYWLALAHPLIGVGPGRFGLWNDTAHRTDGTLINPVSMEHRPIVNGAYGQVGSEIGLIALGLLLLTLLRCCWALRRGSGAGLGLAVFTLIGLNAVPSWTIPPVWIAIASICALVKIDRPTARPLRNQTQIHAIPFAVPAAEMHRC